MKQRLTSNEVSIEESGQDGRLRLASCCDWSVCCDHGAPSITLSVRVVQAIAHSHTLLTVAYPRSPPCPLTALLCALLHRSPHRSVGAHHFLATCLPQTINDEWDSVFPAAASRKRNPGEPKEKIVILGTGWAALEALRKLDVENQDVTVVSPRPFFFYTPLLAGSAVGTVDTQSIVEPIRSFLSRTGTANATYIQASAESVDFQQKVVTAQVGTRQCTTRTSHHIISNDNMCLA